MNTFQPFTASVWLLILATLAICIVFIYIYGKRDWSNDFKPKTLIKLVVAIPIAQVVNETVIIKSDGLRIFLALYVYGFYVITTAYKGGLLSCLTIPVVPSPIGKAGRLEWKDPVV